MAGEQQVHAIGEILTWLEQQLREAREDQSRDAAYLDQLRREVYELSDAVERNERAVREVDPKLLPYKGLPEKIRSLDESTEHIRYQVSSNKAEIDNAVRLLRAEAESDRMERGEAFKRIEASASPLCVLMADISQVQAQSSQVAQFAQALLERQR